MLPFLALGAIAAIGTAVYKYYSSDNNNKNTNDSAEKNTESVHYLQSIAIWGRPNVGKTTFISHLMKKPFSEEKIQTASKKTYKEIPPFYVDGKLYCFDQIIDMPGNVDRLDEWLIQSQKNKHVFYIFNIEKLGDKAYMRNVSSDIGKTMEAMEKENITGAKLHVIASHVDKSNFKDCDQANIINEIMNSDEVRRIYEKLKGSLKGYFYGVNLTSSTDFDNLLSNIVKDINENR